LSAEASAEVFKKSGAVARIDVTIRAVLD